MKLLHVSDLHIGKRVNGISMLEDQRFILFRIASLAQSKAVSAVLIAGDIYDKASPSAEAVALFDAFLTELAGAGVRVLAVPGNHDSPERIAYVQGLLASQGVCFPPVFAGAVERVVIEDEYGAVVFWLVPFLKPGDVRRLFPEREIGDDYSAALRAVLETCDIDESVRNVIVSHQFVTAGGVSPERADDEIKLGGIDNVDVSVYDGFDYVALGHVHRAQRVGRDTVRYAGSPLKYSLSEARYGKSATLVTLGPKDGEAKPGDCVEAELLPLVPLHDMKEIRTTLADLLAGDAPGREDREDYVHVTLTDEHPQLDAMAKIREVYPNAMSLDYDNIVLSERREAVRAAIDPDKVDTVELFSRFYEEQVGNALDDKQVAFLSKTIRSVERGSADPVGVERAEGAAMAEESASDAGLSAPAENASEAGPAASAENAPGAGLLVPAGSASDAGPAEATEAQGGDAR